MELPVILQDQERTDIRRWAESVILKERQRKTPTFFRMNNIILSLNKAENLETELKDNTLNEDYIPDDGNLKEFERGNYI